MKKLFVVLPFVAVMAACSSTKDPGATAPVIERETYDARAMQVQDRRDAQINRSIEQAPAWMTKLPTSDNAVYANGTGVSNDLSMADYKAKMFAYGKICTAAGGRVSQQAKIFMQDTGNASLETSELAIKSMCPAVDITGVETKEIKRISEGGRFRSYVLVALPTGDANQLQQRKDRLKLQDRAVVRSDQAFREMDAVDRKPE